MPRTKRTRRVSKPTWSDPITKCTRATVVLQFSDGTVVTTDGHPYRTTINLHTDRMEVDGVVNDYNSGGLMNLCSKPPRPTTLVEADVQWWQPTTSRNLRVSKRRMDAWMKAIPRGPRGARKGMR